MTQHDNLINGQWVPGKAYAPNLNPSDLSDVVGEYVQGDAADVDAAVAAAKAAFPAWSTSGIQARSDALDKIGTEILARREELGELLAREEGKVRAEAIGEVMRAGQIFKFFAGECLRLAGETVPSVRPGIGVEVTREPIGVVGLITPWNFPSPFQPGRSPRRWPSATAWSSSRPTWCRAAPGRWRTSPTAAGALPACSTWSWAGGV